MKRILLATILLSCIFTCGAYYLLFYRDQQLAQNFEKYTGLTEKVRLGNIGEYSLFNLIAEENGYFKDKGLDADMTEYPSGPAAMADLTVAKVDIVVAAEFVGVSNIS